MLPKCNTEHYHVVCNKTRQIDDEELSAWMKVYCKGGNELCNNNLHQEYADLLGVTREEAKSLAHVVAWRARKGVEILGL